MENSNLTQIELKELLIYSSISGLFYRKISNNRWKAGTIAGGLDKKGYVCICVKGKYYKAHRLAWLYEYGVWPNNQIDHKDMIKNHNWIDNLRDVNNSENQQNIKTHNSRSTLKMLGVTKQYNKFTANIGFNGKRKYLGLFKTKEEAHQAYLIAKRELHSTCTI